MTQNDEYSLGHCLVGEYLVLLCARAIICIHSFIYTVQGGVRHPGQYYPIPLVLYLARVTCVTCISRRLMTPSVRLLSR